MPFFTYIAEDTLLRPVWRGAITHFGKRSNNDIANNEWLVTGDYGVFDWQSVKMN